MRKSWKRRIPFCKRQVFNPDLSISPDQSSRLGLIRRLLQLMHDPDTGLIDIAESGSLVSGVVNNLMREKI